MRIRAVSGEVRSLAKLGSATLGYAAPDAPAFVLCRIEGEYFLRPIMRPVHRCVLTRRASADSLLVWTTEVGTARRMIGQENLIARPEPKSASSLTELAALLDWAEIDRHLAGISAAAKGEPGWPPLALFRALLLATWHDLSDVRLAEALDDRASFRRFATHEPTPERTAFVRFRRELVRRGLDRALFEAVTRQLEAMGVAVRSGTPVDATLVPSASIRRDPEARWAGHRRRKPVHGYKAHVATDKGAGLVLGVEVTTANAHDAAELERVLPADPGEVYGDSAFGGQRSADAIKARGGVPAVVGTGTWGGA
ncbi:MAG TPA: IS5 family transposase, partial [Falsiroseomonas sp.]|nr:IS5 family transposase [Falsiroseomonas sp.]